MQVRRGGSQHVHPFHIFEEQFDNCAQRALAPVQVWDICRLDWAQVTAAVAATTKASTWWQVKGAAGCRLGSLIKWGLWALAPCAPFMHAPADTKRGRHAEAAPGVLSRSGVKQSPVWLPFFPATAAVFLNGTLTCAGSLTRRAKT